MVTKVGSQILATKFVFVVCTRLLTKKRFHGEALFQRPLASPLYEVATHMTQGFALSAGSRPA